MVLLVLDSKLHWSACRSAISTEGAESQLGRVHSWSQLCEDAECRASYIITTRAGGLQKAKNYKMAAAQCNEHHVSCKNKPARLVHTTCGFQLKSQHHRPRQTALYYA